MRIKLLSIIALLVMVLFASCNKADYVSVIPSDASLVVSVDMKTIAEDADMKNSAVVDYMNIYLGAVVSPKGIKQMKEYIDNPADMGIDFREPVYLFKTSNECWGLTMKVASESDVKDFVQSLSKESLCTKPQERDDCYSGTLLDDIQYTFNGKTFMLLASLGDGGKAVNKQASAQLMKQDVENSFASTETFDKMTSMEGAIKYYSDFGALPSSLAEQYKFIIPKGVKKSDVAFLANVKFDKGKATLSSRIWTNSPKVQQLIDDAKKNLHKLNGKCIDTATDNMALWGAIGVNGKWLLNTLKEDKEVKQLLFAVERGIDIEQIINAVDGDVAVAIPFDGTDDVHYVINAELSNADFLADVDYWNESMKEYGLSMHKVGTNAYSLKLDDQNIFWGVSEDKKSVSFSNLSSFNSANANKSVLAEYEDEIKESLEFVYLDVDVLVSSSSMNMMKSIPVLGNFLSKAKCVIVKSSTVDEFEVVYEMKAKDENFLKQLF